MRILFISILTLSYFSTMAQTTIVTSVNQAHQSFQSGNYEESILHWDTVSLAPFFFNNTFFVIVNNAIDGDSASIAFVNNYSESKVKSSDLIKPINLYLKIKFAHDDTILKELNEKLVNTLLALEDTTTYSALYYTASYYLLRDKEYYAQINQEEMVEALSKQNRLASTYKFPNAKELKMYLKLMYAYEYFSIGLYEYQEVLKINLSSNMIRSIGSFSVIQKENSFFKTPYEIKKPILEKQLAKDASEENLRFASSLVSSYPQLDNLIWLKEHYANEETFDHFWHTTSQNIWSKFRGNENINKYIDSVAKKGQWIVLDIWGTWCSPCLQELPHLSDMSNKFKKLGGEPIVFLTLSYQSKDLDGFMKSNNYTFPVLETEKTDMQDLKVNSYPTTFLISPDRKYVEIPWHVDKQEAIRVFTLLDW